MTSVASPERAGGGLHAAADESCSSCLFFLLIICSRLDRGLASVAQLPLPARIDLIGVFLKDEERALELFMGLCVLHNAVGEAHVTILVNVLDRRRVGPERLSRWAHYANRTPHLCAEKARNSSQLLI
jgi:hypothetical protein